MAKRKIGFKEYGWMDALPEEQSAVRNQPIVSDAERYANPRIAEGRLPSKVGVQAAPKLSNAMSPIFGDVAEAPDTQAPLPPLSMPDAYAFRRNLRARQANPTMAGLGDVGTALGGIASGLSDISDSVFGGRAVRGAIMGRPRELMSVLPGSDEYGFTDPRQKASEVDVNRRIGVSAPGDPNERAKAFATGILATPWALGQTAKIGMKASRNPYVRGFMKGEGGAFDPAFQQELEKDFGKGGTQLMDRVGLQTGTKWDDFRGLSDKKGDAAYDYHDLVDRWGDWINKHSEDMKYHGADPGDPMTRPYLVKEAIANQVRKDARLVGAGADAAAFRNPDGSVTRVGVSMPGPSGRGTGGSHGAPTRLMDPQGYPLMPTRYNRWGPITVEHLPYLQNYQDTGQWSKMMSANPWLMNEVPGKVAGAFDDLKRTFSNAMIGMRNTIEPNFRFKNDPSVPLGPFDVGDLHLNNLGRHPTTGAWHSFDPGAVTARLPDPRRPGHFLGGTIDESKHLVVPDQKVLRPGPTQSPNAINLEERMSRKLQELPPNQGWELPGDIQDPLYRDPSGFRGGSGNSYHTPSEIDEAFGVTGEFSRGGGFDRMRDMIEARRNARVVASMMSNPPPNASTSVPGVVRPPAPVVDPFSRFGLNASSIQNVSTRVPGSSATPGDALVRRLEQMSR